MSVITDIKNFLTQVYAPVKRDVAKFIQSVNGVDFVAVASIQLKGKSNTPSYYTDVPLVLPTGLKQLALSALLQAAQQKKGATGVPIDFLPASIQNNIAFIINGKTVKYYSSQMSAVAAVFTVSEFAQVRAKQIALQQQYNEIAKYATNILNNMEKMKAALPAVKSSLVRKIFQDIITSTSSNMKNYLQGVKNNTGIVLQITIKESKVKGIGIIPLVVWAIVAVVGVTGVVVYHALDKKAEVDKLKNLSDSSNILLQQLQASLSNPNLTPEQKTIISNAINKTLDNNSQLQKDVEANSNKPGLLDKVENILLLGLGIYAVSKFVGNGK